MARVPCARRFVTLTASAAAAVFSLGLAGCRAAPKTLAAADLGSNTALRAAAPDYWTLEGAPAGPRWGDRIVLTEFAVEFVTEKLETPFDRQIMATPVTPITLLVSAAGVGKDRIQFAPDDQQRIATTLYHAFLAEMADRGVEVIPPSGLAGDQSYAGLETTQESESGILQFFNFISSDTGRIKQLERRAPKGAALLVGLGADQLDDLQRSLLDHHDADYAMTARFRVGVYRRRGSVEEGSVLKVWGPGGQSLIVSDRSLLTDDYVLSRYGFHFWRGHVSTVSSRRYQSCLRPVLRAYADLALTVLNGHGASDQPSGRADVRVVLAE